MVYELVKVFKKPFGVVLNKCTEEENPSEVFCLAKGATILGKIPFDNKLGALNSDGLVVARELPEYRDLFEHLLCRVKEEATLCGNC